MYHMFLIHSFTDGHLCHLSWKNFKNQIKKAQIPGRERQIHYLSRFRLFNTRFLFFTFQKNFRSGKQRFMVHVYTVSRVVGDTEWLPAEAAAPTDHIHHHQTQDFLNNSINLLASECKFWNYVKKYVLNTLKNKVGQGEVGPGGELLFTRGWEIRGVVSLMEFIWKYLVLNTKVKRIAV